MKVIERDLDGSPKVILATRGEMEKAGYLIAASHANSGSWFRRDAAGVGDFFGENVEFPTVYEKRKP